jgi:hypothetical protein
MWSTINRVKSTVNAIASDVMETAADLDYDVRASSIKNN